MNLAFIDLETLGTDEHTDPIVEVGCIVTYPDLVEMGRWESLVRPAAWPKGWTIPAEVAQMHAHSGLLDAIDGGATIGKADRTLAEVLDDFTEGGQIALAGSGVAHFDGRFIRAQMPETAKRLTYWALDVGVVRRFATKVCGHTDNGLTGVKPHRALEDAQLHLEEARYWRERLGAITWEVAQ